MSKRIYDRTWEMFSKKYRARNIFCEIFLDLHKHITIHSNRDGVVDHIIPIKMGGAKYRRENLMGMSHFFHNVKTSMETATGKPLVDSKKTRSGLIPVDRDQIKRILTKKADGLAHLDRGQVGGGSALLDLG